MAALRGPAAARNSILAGLTRAPPSIMPPSAGSALLLLLTRSSWPRIRCLIIRPATPPTIGAGRKCTRFSAWVSSRNVC